jgi:hypothetical protein
VNNGALYFDVEENACNLNERRKENADIMTMFVDSSPKLLHTYVQYYK